MSKMIKIKDKEFSEDTIVEALKKHCKFEEEVKEKKHQFEPGDVALNGGRMDDIRIITKTDYGTKSIMTDGGKRTTGSHSQDDYEQCRYKFVGRISDFVNEDTIERFKKTGKV